MATYYRWRKSTVVYTEIKNENNRYADSTVAHTLFSNNTYYIGRGISYDENTGTYELSQTNNNGNVVFPSTIATLNDAGECVLFSGGSSETAIEMISGEVIVGTGSSEHDFQVHGVASVSKYYIRRRGTPHAGEFIEYLYSLNKSTYPTGVSGNYYYSLPTTVTSPTAPSGLSYPATITTPNVDVTWTAATSNVPDYPVNGYQVDVSTNGGSSWTLAGNPTTNSLTYSITPGVTSIMFRVRAKDSNGQWGNYVTGTASQVLLAPTLTVPQMAMQGQSIAVNWTAITGADSYTLQRKSSADSDWVQVYSGANTTFSETAGTWTTVQYRVQAVFDGTPGGWATSAEIPVVSASALVISGQDGDLGTLVNDVPYSISTDTGNQITATISVNSAPIFSGNVTSGAASVIPVLDLISGEGTITIEASVQSGSGTVSAVRTWTYTKTIMTFPNAGSIAELIKDGKVMWPETLANAVRLPGGKTLDQVMGFPCQIFTGSYVGTGTYGESNPVEITFPFIPNLWWIFGETDTNGQYSAQDNSIPVPWGKTNLMLNADLTASYAGNTVSFYRSNYPTYNQQGKVYSFLGIKIG